MKIAIITSVYDEREFLPIWRAHYGRMVGLQNLYVLDDGSTDGSTHGLEPSWVIRRPKAPIDQFSKADMVTFFVAQMLSVYDVVVYTDIDELLVIDPLARLSFRNYILQLRGNHFNAIGLNVVHNAAVEPTYDPKLPLLSTRSWIEFEYSYCKQLIHRTPVIFTPGFHHTNKPRNFAPGLYLFHLRAFDTRIALRRIEHRRRLAWTKRSVDNGHGIQNRMREDEYLAAIIPYSPEDFAEAVPEDRFNDFIVRLVRDLSAKPPPQSLWDRKLLRLPERFLSAIPAALEGRAGNEEHDAPDMTQDRLEALFEAALAEARRVDAMRGPADTLVRVTD